MSSFPLKKSQLIVLVLTLAASFLLIYWPHITYPYPFHVDEWHHISEGIRLGNFGEYFKVLHDDWTKRFSGMEIGFHFFLFLLSFVVNLVLVYKFFPAFWMIVSLLALFYVVYRKTKGNFLISWLALIFFMSIRSDVNITGLFFFTPLTFSIPLIYLYVYFFSEALLQERKDYLLASFGIMVSLVLIHSVSVSFFLPTFVILLAIHWRYVRRQYVFFSLFLILPIIALLFYKYTLDIPWSTVPAHIFGQLQFTYGWGILELRNSLLEVYHLLGYVAAAVGCGILFWRKEWRQYVVYLVWPVTVLVLIIIYRTTGISFLSPYQRNLYYFALSLPLLSAIGLGWLIELLTSEVAEWWHGMQFSIIHIVVAIVVSAVTLGFMFQTYYQPPSGLELYQVITADDYATLQFLATLPGNPVMATPFISTALYPVSGHTPVGSIAFYGDRAAVERFYTSTTCSSAGKILHQFNVKYVVTPISVDCGWALRYNDHQNYIYAVR